jgi:hypothetical protein
MVRKFLVVCVPSLFALSACVSMPEGPTVLTLPGTGKPFDQFRLDDMDCRQFASSQLGGASGSSVAADSGVRSAAVGTLLGAAAGAAINGSHGAGVGAGTGLALGGLAGTGTGNASAYALQRRYDHSYVQCMYAKGNRVPVPGGYASDGGYLQQGYVPSPPAGTPPSPPPR